VRVEALRAPNLASPQFKANPYPFYARLRAEVPVYKVRVPVAGSAWLVTRYEDVQGVLKDPGLANDWLQQAPWFLQRFARPIKRGMLNRDASDHTRLRTLVSKAFTPRLVERWLGRVQWLCDELLDRAAADGRMDLVREYALPLPITIIAELLGVPEGDRLKFHAWSRAMVSVSSNARMAMALPGIWGVIRYMRKLFAERRAHRKDDLVTALVQAEETGDRLSEEELVSMAILLVLAGYETTVHLIASGALALLEHPEQRGKFQENPALAESAIEELLRYTSPLDMASVRLAREELKLGSGRIPSGELVLAALGSANHDEAQFPNPETLDLAREPNRHLAFGQGAHFCLGAPLARLEGKMALTGLFRRFPNLRLAQPRETLRWRRSAIFRGLEALPVLMR
jgi:cytochrome P450